MNLNKYIAKEVDEETIKFLKELKQLREENRLLKERLSHLFESEYISLFDEKTKDGIYKYDIREAGLPIEGLNTSYSTVQKLNKPVATSETAVDHPEHYQGKHECIDEMIALFGVEAVKGSASAMCINTDTERKQRTVKRI